jgi:hypothetical protein
LPEDIAPFVPNDCTSLVVSVDVSAPLSNEEKVVVKVDESDAAPVNAYCRTLVPEPLAIEESLLVSYRLSVELPPLTVPFEPSVVVAVCVEEKLSVEVVVKVETPLPPKLLASV